MFPLKINTPCGLRKDKKRKKEEEEGKRSESRKGVLATVALRHFRQQATTAPQAIFFTNTDSPDKEVANAGVVLPNLPNPPRHILDEFS